MAMRKTVGLNHFPESENEAPLCDSKGIAGKETAMKTIMTVAGAKNNQRAPRQHKTKRGFTFFKVSTNSMRTKLIQAGPEVQYGPSTIGDVLKSYFGTSNEPLAVAYRKRQAEKANAEKGGNSHEKQ